MERPNKTTISVQSWYTWEKITLEIAPDSTVDDMKNTFAIIMKFLTFADQERLDTDK